MTSNFLEYAVEILKEEPKKFHYIQKVEEDNENIPDKLNSGRDSADRSPTKS